MIPAYRARASFLEIELDRASREAISRLIGSGADYAIAKSAFREEEVRQVKLVTCCVTATCKLFRYGRHSDNKHGT